MEAPANPESHEPSHFVNDCTMLPVIDEGREGIGPGGSQSSWWAMGTLLQLPHHLLIASGLEGGHCRVARGWLPRSNVKH